MVCLNEKSLLTKKINELTEVESELSDCQRENTTVHQERDNLFEQLQTCESKPEHDEDHKDNTGLYIWISVTIIQFSIIIILLWKLKSKNGVESIQGESGELR
jgi:ABC-type Zn2+ transport system substrate-binding protein/surface adhesin